MKLPNRNKVVISQEKLMDYLLSETHSVGKFKAKFFRTVGFNESNAAILKENIREIARNSEVKQKTVSKYGTKYILDGEIKTPTDDTIKLRTIWIIELNYTVARFVTAYPV
jgi:hypothetical protein